MCFEINTARLRCVLGLSQVLRGARIVGMTTTGLANQQGLLHGLQPKVGRQKLHRLCLATQEAQYLRVHMLTESSTHFRKQFVLLSGCMRMHMPAQTNTARSAACLPVTPWTSTTHGCQQQQSKQLVATLPHMQVSCTADAAGDC